MLAVVVQRSQYLGDGSAERLLKDASELVQVWLRASGDARQWADRGLNKEATKIPESRMVRIVNRKQS